jgi:hypothetical protein
MKGYLFRDENVAENVARRSKLKDKSLIKLVGAGRFELPTPCSRSKRFAPAICVVGEPTMSALSRLAREPYGNPKAQFHCINVS